MMVCLLGASRTQYGLFTSALFRSNPCLVFCCNLKVKRHIFIWKNFALSATELEKPSASHMNYKCTLAVLKLEFLRSQSQTEQVTRCQSFFIFLFFKMQFLVSDCLSSNPASSSWARHLISPCLSVLINREHPGPSLKLVW